MQGRTCKSAERPNKRVRLTKLEMAEFLHCPNVGSFVLGIDSPLCVLRIFHETYGCIPWLLMLPLPNLRVFVVRIEGNGKEHTPEALVSWLLCSNKLCGAAFWGKDTIEKSQLERVFSLTTLRMVSTTTSAVTGMGTFTLRRKGPRGWDNRSVLGFGSQVGRAVRALLRSIFSTTERVP